MVDSVTLTSVQNYLRHLVRHGIETPCAVLFGSQASGKADEWSDIDLVIVSPVFDGAFPREMVNQLWRAAARTDSRIEPIPCGERQWQEDTVTPILEIARQDGVRISLEHEG